MLHPVLTQKIDISNSRAVIRYVEHGLKLHYRSNWRATGLRHTLVFSDTTLSCVHAILQAHTYITITYLMTAYYTPNDGFTANDASFYAVQFLS